MATNMAPDLIGEIIITFQHRYFILILWTKEYVNFYFDIMTFDTILITLQLNSDRSK